MSQPATEPFTKSLERMNRFQEPEARVLIADLGLPEGSRGLDVGCGVGLFALWLAEAIGPRGRVLGIEPSTERVEAARAVIGDGPLASRLEFREGDATELDAPDATFDWVWCGDVLHHVQETARALGEFARVVRPGGRIIVKESQLLHGTFLPGHPELERRLRQAEMEWSRHEGGEFSFEERRQRTLAVATRGWTVRGALPDVSAGATGAASPRRARLYSARRLRAQLGPAPARSLDRRRLGAPLRPLRAGVGDLRPGRSRLLLPLSHQRARRPPLIPTVSRRPAFLQLDTTRRPA